MGGGRSACVGVCGFLGQLRAEAGLTQEELAQAAGLGLRTVSDLERGAHRTAHQDTARFLADALGLTEPVRGLFVAAARGRAPAAEVLAAREDALTSLAAAATGDRLSGGAGGAAGVASGCQRVYWPIGGADRAGLAAAQHHPGERGRTVGPVVISAVSGTAGVGKTALAVRWAHRWLEAFPGGQLYVNLRGYDPDRPMARGTRWPGSCARWGSQARTFR